MIKKIHQIYISDGDQRPKSVRHIEASVMKLYDDYEYILWNNKSIQSFIDDNFDPHVRKAYDNIKPYAYKSDFARYLILYKMGGIYFDLGLVVKRKFEFNDDVVIVFNNERKLTENNVIVVNEIHSHLMLKLYEECIHNSMHCVYGENPLFPTGPEMFLEVYKNSGVSARLLDVSFTGEHNKFVMVDDMVWYYFKSDNRSGSLAFLETTGTNNYNDMWHANDVYIEEWR